MVAGVKLVSMMLTNTGRAGPAAQTFARHSQTAVVPVCPPGHERLWEGYSLLHTEDDGRAYVQDLGSNKETV
jgi:collagen type IV alpha